MSYSFRKVEIFTFDIHSTVKSLLDPQLVAPGFSFLTDPAQYKNAYSARKVVTGKTFKAQPLSPRALKRNHFWRRYCGIWHGGKQDLWKLQPPFVCDLQSPKIDVTAPGTGTQAKVGSRIYLSALGWSTNIEISLSGEVSPQELRTFIGALGKDSVFRLDGGTPQNLSVTFKAMASQLQKEVFAPAGRNTESMGTSRHLITCITDFQGSPIARYAQGDFDNVPPMESADRALMLGLLYGREVTAREVAQKEKDRAFMVTSFGGPNFSLTDFERGTLLFIQKSHCKNPQASLRCLGSNVRFCSMMTLAVKAFYESSAGYADNSQVKELRDAIKFTLTSLPLEYKNRFCLKWCKKHTFFQQFV